MKTPASPCLLILVMMCLVFGTQCTKEDGGPDTKAPVAKGANSGTATASTRPVSRASSPGVLIRARQPGDQEILDQFGIEVVAIRESAKGYMLDFRYRVVNPEKAAKIVNRQIEPYVLHHKTQSKLYVFRAAKVGAMRQTSTQPVPGRVFFNIFANPGNLVKPGDKVTVVIGAMKTDETVLK